jgi:hypothetical protein
MVYAAQSIMFYKIKDFGMATTIEKQTQRYPNLKRGNTINTGRKKGSKDKIRIELVEFIGRVLTDLKYQRNLLRRIHKGQANHIELYMWQIAAGKPVEHVDLSNTDGTMRPIHIYLPKKDPLPALEPAIAITPTPDAEPASIPDAVPHIPAAERPLPPVQSDVD